MARQRAMASFTGAIDGAGVAVITGGASGFGLEAARRCAGLGMRTAILDVSDAALTAAHAELVGLLPGSAADGAATLLPIVCDVGSWQDCAAAAAAVETAFGPVPVAFLFNNAGVASLGGTSQSLFGTDDSDSNWRHVFGVNVFGAVNILRTFVPRMVAAGPLRSGRQSVVVTTSSVMGLYDGAMGLSAYNASKMACTAICEMAFSELESAGEDAAHISAHSLHPSMAGTNIFGSSELGKLVAEGGAATGGAGLSAADVIDSMLLQIVAGRAYLIVDDANDVPAAEQIRGRMQAQMTGLKPHTAPPMASLAGLRAAVEQAAAEDVLAAAKL